MRKKLTNNEFLLIKDEIFKNFSKNQVKHNSNKVASIIFANEVKEKIFSFDLSDVPFSSWYNFFPIYCKPIFYDHIDLSETHANLDFDWIFFDFRGGVNLKGCKIKNLDGFKGYYTDDSFDKETIEENEEFFLNDKFPLDFREKYYRCNLFFEDIINLSEENLKVFLTKNHNFNEDDTHACFIESIELEKCIRIYEYDKELFNSMSIFLDEYYSYLDKIEYICIKEDLSIIKKEYYNLLYETITEKSFDLSKTDSIFTSEFKSLHKDIFSLPNNVLEEIFTNKLSLENVIKYVDILTDFHLEEKIDYEDYYSSINNIFKFLNNTKDITLQDLIKKYPSYFNSILCKSLEFDTNILNGIDNKKFQMRYNSIQFNILDIFCEEVVFDTILKRNFMFPRVNENIYLPKWIEEMGYTNHEDITNVFDLMNLPKNAIVKNKAQNKLFYCFGIENIQMLEKETNIFSEYFNEYFNLFLDYVVDKDFNELKYVKVKGYDNFREYIANLLAYFKKEKEFINIPNYDFIEGKFRDDFPKIFIDKNAPEELKNCFYCNEVFPNLLMKHPEWKKYIIGKDYASTLGLNAKNNELESYFRVFSFDEGIKLLTRQESVALELITSHNPELLYFWYEESNRTFVPCEVVMYNFPNNMSHKFINNKNLWKILVNIENFNNNDEGKEALLKLAYTLGVFAGNIKSTNEIRKLLTFLPNKISIEDYLEYDRIISEEIRNDNPSTYVLISDIKKLLKEKGINIEANENFIGQFYKPNNNHEYKLIYNMESMIEVNNKLKRLMDKCLNKMITPERIHHLFGGFEFTYDEDFMKFFFDNSYEILYTEKGEKISRIQNRFKEIKAINSARHLTLDLAIKFIETNVFSNIEVGNVYLSNLCSIAGYSQNQFDKVQKIYNYSKTRILSSIPKIKGTFNEFTYEILDLNDPLGIVIGSLTDCCQEIGNAADTCMEHSMISPNGRIFVIKDKEARIIAQSWVWRVGETLCFDNIEVPRKILKQDKSILESIFKIYKIASLELIKTDRINYEKLKHDGYLKRITVGIGYNDIKEIIDKNLKPCSYTNPPEYISFFTNKKLYINDSLTQYSFYEDGTLTNTKELNIYKDSYIIKDRHTFNEEDLTMWKLFKITVDKEKEINDYYTLMDYYGIYNFNIIIDPNFILIFESENEITKIVDLIFIDKVIIEGKEIDLTETITFKIKEALKQMGNNFDTTLLNDYKLDMINECLEECTNILTK